MMFNTLGLGIFLLICHSSSLLLVAAQSEFISIDCGLPDGLNYTSDIGLYYVSDSDFIDSGITKKIDRKQTNASRIYQTVRFFPDYKRNCYMLPAERGISYLLRAYFIYANYNESSSNLELIFDLYLGVDLWETIKLDNRTGMYWTEFGSRATATTMNVCLVKTTATVPFISALELRPLKGQNLLYTNFTASASFTTFMRVDVGATAEVRYPDDPYDRIWRPDNGSYGTPISTNKTVAEDRLTIFGLPSAVMQTAAATSSGPIVVTWSGGSDAGYHLAMHFAEIANNKTHRKLTIKNNGDDWFSGLIPDYLNSQSVYSTQPLLEANYSFSVEAKRKKVGPILNAFEVFKVVQPSGHATQTQDVDAINAIKNYYSVKRNWNGDPCLPQNFPWDGLTCSYENYSAARIVSLDLSNSKLKGVISSSISQLTALQKLNLSRNNLDGPIPSSLQQLLNLSNLDLSSNNLSGSLPSTLQQRADSGKLLLSIDSHNNPQISKTAPSVQVGKSRKKRNIIIAVVVVATLVALISLSSVFIVMKKKRKPPQGSNWSPMVH